MNALNKVARGERTTIVVIALVAAVALALGVGGFFMARTFLTSADSGTTASKASSDSNGGMSGDSSPSETSQAPDTAPQSEAAPTPEATTTTPAATASPMPPCEDGTAAPDGTCLHPASIQWLDDLLPDPTTINRTDPDAVCSAFVITHETWDAARDVTNAYASIRSSVYETPERQAHHTPTPDLEKGQGEFLPLVPGRSHTTVTIEMLSTEGKDPSPDRVPGKWLRIVTYTRAYADGSHEPVRGYAFLTLTQQEDGTWAVSEAVWS